MRRIIVAALLLASGFSLPAMALDFKTVQGLYAMCKQAVGSSDQLICLGYISGVGNEMIFNGVAWAQHHSGKKMPWDDDLLVLLWGSSLCGNPSYGAMIQAFVNWAEKHPEKWGHPSVLGVIQAFRETWPCESRISN